MDAVISRMHGRIGAFSAWMLLFRGCMDDYMDIGGRAKQEARADA